MFFKYSRKSIDNGSPSTNMIPSSLPQIVTNCRVCDMINIGDKMRILCPYCGSFYDPRIQPDSKGQALQTLKRNSLRSAPLPRLDKQSESFSTSESSSISQSSQSKSSDTDVDTSDTDSDESQQAQQSGGRVKNFLKNLLNLSKKNSKSNPNLTKLEHQKMRPRNSAQAFNRTNSNDQTKETPVHPFLTIKNKESNFNENLKSKFRLDFENFKKLVNESIENNDFKEITDFYCWNFSKSSNLIDLLVTEKHSRKKGSTNSNKKHDASFYVSTDWKYMKEIYTSLLKMPKQVIRLALKSICFCVVNDLKPTVDILKIHVLRHRTLSTRSEEDEDSLSDSTKSKSILIDQQNIEVVHSYVIFLCNPLFDLPENNVLFSIILCEIASFNSHLQSSLIYALRRMPLNLFRDVLRQIQYFLIIRLFPNSKQTLVPLVNDWLISSVKVMALLHYTNEMQIQYYQNHYSEYVKDAQLDFKQKQKYWEKIDNQVDDYPAPSNLVTASTNFSSLFVSYQDFYIKKLDSLNLYKEYLKWQQMGKHDRGFSFCRYPFMLSIDGKRKILERDSETQMISTAKQSFLKNAKVRNNVVVNTGDLFLTIKIRRNNLISDSLNEIEMKKTDLKKKLRVNFLGEAAIDMGGVRKEWFLLLIRQIFSPVYGMFTYIKESENYWFATNVEKTMLAEFNLIGVLMGLAVYNGEILDIRFPPCVYKKLLSENSKDSVGILTNLNLYDLKLVMPSIANSLQDLLDYEGNVQDDFMMKFVISYTEFDIIRTVELKENGANIDLTNDNRKEFVDLYLNFLLNKSIYEQFKAFYTGFHSVCASNAILLFRPEEIELLVCGSPEPLNINELRLITLYENYIEKDDIIEWFWDIIKNEFDTNQKKRFLLFTTGSDRVPIGGFKEMNFKICRIECKNQLPMAHTCFNQLLLPHFKSRDILKSKLLIAIENAEGFGFK